MNDTDSTTERLQDRVAYLGTRGRTRTADLLPTRSMPFGLTVPGCRDAAAFLTGLVRGAYVRNRRQHRAAASGRPDDYGERHLADWDGGYDWRGRYHPPVWARIAGAALERGLDVEDYVEKAFARAAAGSPLPNKLLSDAALVEYDRAHMGKAVHLLRVKRGVDEVQLGLGIGRWRSLRGESTLRSAALGVLRDPTSGMRPFHRYLVAARFIHEAPELAGVLARYHRPALHLYAASVRAHDAAYDRDVPEDLRSVVAMTRRAFAELIADDQGRWVAAPAGPDAGA